MKSDIYQTIIKPSVNKLAFIDIDNTLTANPWETNEKDLLDKKLSNQAIDLLQKFGYLCILNTSRTEEMCMSSTQFLLSQKKYNFKRPKPQIGMTQQGKRFYAKPEDIYPCKLLDHPIIISSSGAKISVLQKKGGYQEDTDFYPSDFPDPGSWRKDIILQLATIKKRVPFMYAPIESEDAFIEQKTDVYPPDYRLQLSFHSVYDLIDFAQESKEQKCNFFLTNDSDPDKHSFILYITPKTGKFEAIEHIMAHLAGRESLEILFIGDSWPDFEAGMHNFTHFKAKKTVLLVGGSRLFPYLTDSNKNNFAGIDLAFIKNQLSPSGQTGIFTYTDAKTNDISTVIVSDLAYPKAIGPKSIVEYLS